MKAYALTPVIGNLVEFMDQAVPEDATSADFFMQADGDTDKHMYDFVWEIWKIERGEA